MALDQPLTQAQINAAALRDQNEGYIHRVLVAGDDLGAALFDAQNDQTISSQTEIDRHRKNVVFRALATVIADGLDVIQRSHGQLAQVGDVVRDEKDLAINQAALKAETGDTVNALPVAETGTP